jgi:hypothetical protein
VFFFVTSLHNNIVIHYCYLVIRAGDIIVFDQPFIYFADTNFLQVAVDLYSVNPVVHYGVQNWLRWHPPQGVRDNKGNLTIVTLSRGWSRPFAGLGPLSDDVSMKKP